MKGTLPASGQVNVHPPATVVSALAHSSAAAALAAVADRLAMCVSGPCNCKTNDHALVIANPSQADRCLQTAPHACRTLMLL